MILYIEGPDGSGKSTLSKRVGWYCGNRNIDCTYAEPSIQTHPKRPGRITRRELIGRLYEMFMSNTTVYILDRGPISDCIYRLFDEYDPVAELSEIVDMFSRYKDRCLVIYCNNNKAEEYMLERGDDNPVAIAKHKKISEAYEMVMPLLADKVDYWHYDFTNDLNVRKTNTLIETRLKGWFGGID